MPRKTRRCKRNNRSERKETLILIPLSSRYYAVYWNTQDNFIVEDNCFKILKDDEIKLINKTIINNSYLKCVSVKKEGIEEVLPEYQMHYPSQVFAGGSPSGYFTGAIKKKEVFFYTEEQKAWELIDFSTFTLYKDLGRNDKCKCQSGKKFKKCHESLLKKVRQITSRFRGYPFEEGRSLFGINGAKIFELPVDKWAGFDNSNKNNKNEVGN